MSYVPTALVTGASSGIGAAFAKALARRGFNVVLVARRAERLEQVADVIALHHGRKAYVLPADLTVGDAVAKLVTALAEREIPIDLLVNNAGTCFYEEFHQQSPDQVEHMLELNVRALTRLCHTLLPTMIGRGTGAIINVASTAAFQPIPYGAVYAASKGYVLSFSEALAEEVGPRGIRVLCLCPGSTESEIHGHSGVSAELMKFAPLMPAEQVAEGALNALEAGKRVHVPGPVNEVQAWLSRVVPRDVAARVAGMIFKPGRLQ